MFTADKEMQDIIRVMNWKVYDEPSRVRRKEAIKTFKAIRVKKLKSEAASIKKKLVKEKGRCEICGYSFEPILQIHHILPLSSYGDNCADNILCVCPNCHKALHYMYGKEDEEVDRAVDEYSYRYGKFCGQMLHAVYNQYLRAFLAAIKYFDQNLVVNKKGDK